MLAQNVLHANLDAIFEKNNLELAYYFKTLVVICSLVRLRVNLGGFVEAYPRG